VPFTDKGRPSSPFFAERRSEGREDGGGGNATTNETKNMNPGFVHMASVLLAMEHFNQRNATVVPEIASLGNCSFRFDVNGSVVFDTGTDPEAHAAVRAVAELRDRSIASFSLTAESNSNSRRRPCAAVGPFHDAAALDLGYFSSAYQFPIVMHRYFNVRAIYHPTCPFSNSVYPDIGTLTEKVARFLVSMGRTDFISVLYPLTDLGLQWKDICNSILNALGMQTFSIQIYNDLQESRSGIASPSVEDNLRTLKTRGFRTIVVLLDDPERNLALIANAAELLRMNEGDYFWIWVGDFAPSHLYSANRNITKLLFGSAWVLPIEDASAPGGEAHPLQQALASQGPGFVALANQLNPVHPGEPGYVYADEDLLRSLSNGELEYGASYIYDAVMSIGCGACAAAFTSEKLSNVSLEEDDDSNNYYYYATSNVSGAILLEGIRASFFTGATGPVRFSGLPDTPGTRHPKTGMFGAYNLVPGDRLKPYELAAVFAPEVGAWQNRASFTYADGRSVPPDFLRDPPPQNFLPTGLVILGLFLFGSVVLMATAASLWVFWKGKNRVVRAAQPCFLHLLALGATIFSSAIVPLSFDESDGWSETQLSRACQSVPWLIAIGHIVTYSSLAGKLWRVNKVLQFRRQRISVQQVLWPFAILGGAALLVLALWTGLDPLEWTRVEIDPWTGESIAYCQSPNTLAYAIPLGLLMFIPTVLTGVMAWKTKDVDSAYSDSYWIFTMILVQLELLVIGIPVVIILRTVSITGRYIGFVLLLWVFPMSTLALILLPKFLAYRRDVLGVEVSVRTRGSREAVRVTGIPSDPRVLDSSKAHHSSRSADSDGRGPSSFAAQSSEETVRAEQAP
jgi:hypothetical protein